jgi:hypothetical protein
MLIDETACTEAGSYRLTQTHHLAGHTVRVRVHRDFYPQQSWAVADVLTPALAWTELATSPAQEWQPATYTPRTTATAAAARDTLRPIAEHLTERVHRMLDNTRTAGPAAESHPAAGPAS